MPEGLAGFFWVGFGPGDEGKMVAGGGFTESRAEGGKDEGVSCGLWSGGGGVVLGYGESSEEAYFPNESSHGSILFLPVLVGVRRRLA